MSGPLPQHGEILLYDNGTDKQFVSVVFKDETFWLTQSGMAELFDCSADNISLHLKNIYADGELEQAATTEKFSVVRKEGSREVRRSIDHYDLDAIIAVGYRVNSKKATHFRQWATKTLKEYIQKGFVLNDELMKNGRLFGKDYFDELLERIREIRASERRAYQKIADVFEQCSYDYDKNSETTKAFYAFVQNKLHFAVTGKTAAELCSYIDAGMPVVFWATLDFQPVPEKRDHWLLADGTDFAWKCNEHCLLLVGYDDENYWFNDPWHDHGVCPQPKQLVEDCHAAQGLFAVTLRPKGEV